MLATLALLLIAQTTLPAGQFEHKPLEKALRGQQPVLKLVLHNHSTTFAPIVFARPGSKGRFFSYPMAERGKDVFIGRLPVSVTAGEVFDYFIEARLVSGERSTIGTEQVPFVVNIEEAPIQPASAEVASVEGAVISLDGVEQGKAPRVLEADPGMHTVAVTLPDGRGAEQAVEFVAGKRKKVSLVPGAAAGAPGKLVVSSEPPGARVYLDGLQIGVTPFAADGSAGPHLVALELDGYLREQREVLLRDGRDVELRFPLAALPREPALAVGSAPEGATVLIDGTARGATPWVGALAAGRHEVVLKMKGRREVSTDFVMPAGRDLSLHFDLLPPAASEVPRLLVYSKPEGASVLIDSAPAGVTPWSGEVKAGAHRVEVSYEGYLPEQREVTAAKSREVEVSFQLLRPPGPAHLLVETDPAGAALTVDDKPAGITPLAEAITLEPGEHQIAARKDGFLALAQTITAEQGQTVALRLAMMPAPKEPLPPTVAANTDPPGARFYLDGKLAGETPGRVRTTPGPHEIRFALDGYLTRTGKLKVPGETGFELRLTVSLKKIRDSETIDRPDPVALARAQLQHAQACFKLADYPCALAAYKAVYEVKPLADLLFNIGQTHRKLGNLASAIDTFNAYLREVPKGPRADAARKLIAQMEAAQKRGESQIADDDVTPPAVKHLPLTRAVRGEELRVSAFITDDKSGVGLSQLCYRNSFAPDYQCAQLTPGSSDESHAAIPGAAVRDGLAYYLEASDNVGNGPTGSGTREKPNLVAIDEPRAALPPPPTTQLSVVEAPPLPPLTPVGGEVPRHSFGRGDWSLSIGAGGERANEDYLQGNFLGHLLIGLQRAGLFGATVARLEAELRLGSLEYRGQTPRPGQPAGALQVSEVRTRVAGSYGIDLLRALELSAGGALSLTPAVLIEYQRLQNQLYPFDYAGLGAQVSLRWEVLGPVAVLGSFSFTDNLKGIDHATTNAVGNPRRDVAVRAGVEIALPPRYTAQLAYTADALMLSNSTRSANGVVAGLGAVF